MSGIVIGVHSAGVHSNSSNLATFKVSIVQTLCLVGKQQDIISFRGICLWTLALRTPIIVPGKREC